jgi:pilus assembly protein CpaB
LSRKWSPRSKLFAGLAAVLALAAFGLASSYAQRLSAMDPGSPTRVLVAARDLARGTALEEGTVNVGNVPAAFVPPGAVAASQDVSGKMLLAPIAAGEVITSSRLGDLAGPVAALVPSGLRAVMVPTDMPPGVLTPGDRVDVLATYTGGQPYTETVAASVEIIDTLDPGGGGLGEGPSGPVLVLLTDPSSAEDIAHAVAAARVDVAVVGPEGVTRSPQPTPAPFAADG